MYALKVVVAVVAGTFAFMTWMWRPFGDRTLVHYASERYVLLPVLDVTFDLAFAVVLLFFGIGVMAGAVEAEQAMRRKKNT